MKNGKCGKKDYAKLLKTSSKAIIQMEPEKPINITNIEYFISETEKMKEIEILLNKFLKDAIQNLLINEYEAGDIRFMINDYLSNSNQIIPDYYNPDEDELNDDLL